MGSTNVSIMDPTTGGTHRDVSLEWVLLCGSIVWPRRQAIQLTCGFSVATRSFTATNLWQHVNELHHRLTSLRCCISLDLNSGLCQRFAHTATNCMIPNKSSCVSDIDRVVITHLSPHMISPMYTGGAHDVDLTYVSIMELTTGGTHKDGSLEWVLLCGSIVWAPRMVGLLLQFLEKFIKKVSKVLSQNLTQSFI